MFREAEKIKHLSKYISTNIEYVIEDDCEISSHEYTIKVLRGSNLTITPDTNYGSWLSIS